MARGRRSLSILVGASSFADAAAGIRLAKRVTLETTGSLGGLLVEDENLLALCSLPNRHVITATGSVLSAPTPDQIRTLIEADSRAFRKVLADAGAAGGSAGAPYFERLCGDLTQAMSEAAPTWDVLVFGHQELHAVAGQVVVLERTDTDGRNARHLAEHLARDMGCALVRLAVAGHAAEADPAGAADTATVCDGLAAALARLARINAQAVVVDLAQGPVATPAQLRRVLSAARCPVVALNPSGDWPRPDNISDQGASHC